jgi:hypothetical protein
VSEPGTLLYAKTSRQSLHPWAYKNQRSVQLASRNKTGRPSSSSSHQPTKSSTDFDLQALAKSFLGSFPDMNTAPIENSPLTCSDMYRRFVELKDALTLPLGLSTESRRRCIRDRARVATEQKLTVGEEEPTTPSD